MKKKIIAIVLIIIAIIGIAVYNVQKNIKEKGKVFIRRFGEACGAF